MFRVVDWVVAPLLVAAISVAPLGVSGAQASPAPQTDSVETASTSTATPTQTNMASALYSVQTERAVHPGTDKEQAEELKAAKQYIALQRKSWDAKAVSQYWARQHEVATEKAESLQRGLDILEGEVTEAQEKAAQSRAELARWALRSPGAMGENPSTLEVFMAGSDHAMRLLQERKDEQLQSDSMTMKLATADADQTIAEQSQEKLVALRREVTQLVNDADRYLQIAVEQEEDSRELLTEAQGEWSAALLAATQRDPELGVRMLETALTAEWNSIVAEIGDLDIAIPSIDDLANTRAYPEALDLPAALDPRDQTGAAMRAGTLIPSQEALKRVTWALEQVGKPYLAPEDYKASGKPEGYSCDAFVSHALGAKKVRNLDFAYEKSGRQNHSLSSTIPGDIVFFANPSSGIHQAGVYVTGGFVVTASAAAGTVSLERVGADAITSVRPGLDNYDNTSAPVRPEASDDKEDALPRWVCGAVEGGNTDEAGSAFGWHSPLATDDYEIGAKFEEADERFSTKLSPGLEFLVSKEQTVHAPYDGVVIYADEDPTWGNTVIIEHDSGLQARYAFLDALSTSEGATVTSGQVIATIAPPGEKVLDDEDSEKSKKDKKDKKGKKNKEVRLTDLSAFQYGLMLTVESSGMLFDPEHLVFPVLNDQYANGRIPASALCKISAGGLLRCDAARSFEMLAAAYKEHFNTSIIATDTYRSLAGQIRCKAIKGDMCATPGTSNHGWGIAIDFGGGINNFGTPQHLWMVQNAGKFGWHLPAWAQKNGSLPEAWHWEFQRI